MAGSMSPRRAGAFQRNSSSRQSIRYTPSGVRSSTRKPFILGVVEAAVLAVGRLARFAAPEMSRGDGFAVALMGQQGFGVLPYYEYAGSKGDRGLGYQRRCKPLTRDDAYTHISWVESANADLTDPDTYADFKKMLDVTVLRLKDKAQFETAYRNAINGCNACHASQTSAAFPGSYNYIKVQVPKGTLESIYTYSP